MELYRLDYKKWLRAGEYAADKIFARDPQEIINLQKGFQREAVENGTPLDNTRPWIRNLATPEDIPVVTEGTMRIDAGGIVKNGETGVRYDLTDDFSVNIYPTALNFVLDIQRNPLDFQHGSSYAIPSFPELYFVIPVDIMSALVNLDLSQEDLEERVRELERKKRGLQDEGIIETPPFVMPTCSDVS
ncbi:hypothetical protein HOC80_03420 [archaeon]|jgi:hypothetical protein|nr:hypothetical protein [archaeon]MBT4417126.1 hypothetical protein [archaeon]